MQALRELAQQKLSVPEAEAALPELQSDSAKALLALMQQPEPEAVPALLQRLPADVQADLQALDLKQQNLNPLRARVHLIHGQHDPLIPASQSVSLAAALPGAHSLTLADGLEHVSFSCSFGISRGA
ncbi:MAG: hypothetical protein IGS03_18275 [Candidatus Sericytochromatia bacterium]|nr:hypothetical protein [Candidatus Sericytochromatia bacterium]